MNSSIMTELKTLRQAMQEDDFRCQAFCHYTFHNLLGIFKLANISIDLLHITHHSKQFTNIDQVNHNNE